MYIQIFLSKQERSGVRGLHTGDTGIVNFFRLYQCFCRSTYKHKTTIVNVLRPTKVEKQNCIKTLQDSIKPQDCQKLAGDNDTQCIPYFIDQMLPSYSYCSQLSIIVVYM